MNDLRPRLLVWLLRIAGCALLLAWPHVFLPTQWMAMTHASLGLGEFPDTAIVQYLTRSIAALYGMHGILFLLASRDVERMRPLVLCLGALNVVFGSLMVGVDLHAGMPPWWTWGEGPSILAMGVAILVLGSGVTDRRR